MRKLLDWPLVCLLAVALSLLAVPQMDWGLALSVSQQTLGGNTLTTRNLVAPTNLTANAAGHDVQLGWTAGQQGDGYSVLGVANGNNSDCSAAVFGSIGSTAGTSFTDSGRFSPQGSYFCYQVKTTYGPWSSQLSNPIAAGQIGFVANTLTIQNDGDHSACSGSGSQQFGQSGFLDCGDQVIVGFNQAVDPASGPTSSQTVCAGMNLTLASTTATGNCETASFKVGSFTKSLVTGSQVVAHALGETPKALILWTNSDLNESFTGSFMLAFGVGDGTTSKAISAASQDAVGTSNTSSRIANKVLTIVQWGQVLIAEADLSSVDATNFTLNWTTNNNQGYVIHFIAIGGSAVSAKVVGWTMPTATGNKAVTGVGFKPDLVIHFHANDTFTANPPTSVAGASLGVGAMEVNGSQWANHFLSLDNQGTSNTQRGQQTNAAILAFNSSLSLTKKASFVTMDADGFTVNFSTANGNASQVFSLALKGVKAKAGNFTKSITTPTATQAVTGAGFQPRLLLLASFQDVTQANPVAHTRLGFGASDTINKGSAALTDADAAGTSIAKSIDKTSKVFVKVNNNTPAVDAEANLTSLDSDGFTLNWTTNDAVATQMTYLALAPLTLPNELLVLGQLSGGSVGVCNCRFNAAYTLGNSNKTMTVTIGARVTGANYPSVSSSVWSFSPTTIITKMLSSTGAFHICDNNSASGNCLPATSGPQSP